MDIDLTIKNYRCFSDEKPARISLRRGLTAFVGPNNSGKSSLLKFFYEFRGLFLGLAQSPEQFVNGLHTRVPFNPPQNISDINELSCNRNDRDIFIELSFTPTKSGSRPPLLTQVELQVFRGDNSFNYRPLIASEYGQIDRTKPFVIQGPYLVQDQQRVFDLTEIREACRQLSKTLYIGAFRNILNLSTKNNYFDIHVGEAFVKQWKSYKTGGSRFRNDVAYKIETDVKRIFGYTDLQINPSDNDQTLHLFVDGKPYALPELGSGIAQFILTLANAATENPSFILIDEPELNLHPSLQLDFITSLAAYASEGLLFATHSVGLARSAAEMVYSLQKPHGQPTEVSDFNSTPRLSEFLGELSFLGYRELGFDRVLLVEGPTDVRTVQQFLRKFGKDHSVLPLSLGGNSLINGNSGTIEQLEEMKRISGNIFAVIDSERTAKGDPPQMDRERFRNACQKAGIKCLVLERRAIENYLTDIAVKKVKGEKYRALEEFELLKTVSPAWAKSENWLIAREMTREEIEPTDLGQFLKNL